MQCIQQLGCYTELMQYKTAKIEQNRVKQKRKP